MILVVGGTGRLGREVVHRLSTACEGVRVLARRSAPSPSRVEVVTGDVRDPGACARAVRGVRTVVSAMHGFAEDPRGIDLRGNENLIAAATEADVEHVVLLSVHGAAPDHPIDLFRAKHAAEQRLTASPLAWTIVRPTAFMELWVSLLAAPLMTKGSTVVFGPGTNPINFVSVHDVADLVVRASTDATMRGHRLEVGGPEDLSFRQLVATFERVAGVTGAKRHVPLSVMRVAASLLSWIRPSIARQIRAAIAMNTRDMTFRAARSPAEPAMTLADAIRRELAVGTSHGTSSATPIPSRRAHTSATMAPAPSAGEPE